MDSNGVDSGGTQMSGTTSGTGGLDRRALIRSGAAGVAGGLAAWTAPAILLATPAMASTMYYAQYSDFEGNVSAWKWETTTAPGLDLAEPSKTEWENCKPSGWQVGVSPNAPVLVPVPTGVSGDPVQGKIVFTAHSTCRIKEAYATYYSPGASGGTKYKCQVGVINEVTWTGNTATFAALSNPTGDTRLAFRFLMECGS